jgi:hypothetical protein
MLSAKDSKPEDVEIVVLIKSNMNATMNGEPQFALT